MLDELYIDSFIEQQGIFYLGGLDPVEQWIVVLSSGLDLIHDFARNLYTFKNGLMMNPAPKLWNLIELVIAIARGDKHVCIKEIEHLLPTARASRIDERVYVTRLDAEHLPCLRVR